MVSKSDGDKKKKKKINWWRLVPNPAKHSEYSMLKISGAWELIDNSRAQGSGLSTRPYSSVFSQDIGV